MNVAERDFSSFELGDSVHKLAGGVIPEMAELAGVAIGDQPDSETLGELVGKFGKDKVLRNNQEVDIPIGRAADLAERAGVQNPISRSLWTPDLQPDKKLTVITGAVANWQDRVASLVAADAPESDAGKSKVYIPVGKRIMDTGTEKTNPNVSKFFEENGRYPSESEYALHVVAPKLMEAGKHVILAIYDTKDGSEIARNFVSDYSDLFEVPGDINFARVANAGIQLAVQFRQAALARYPEFDSVAYAPRVFVQTDGLRLARTQEEKANPTEFQSPYTALRQVALTAKMLHLAAQDTPK